MRKIYKLNFTVLLLLTVSFSAFAQTSFFTDLGANKNVATTGKKALVLKEFRTSFLDVQSMRSFLSSLPSENQVINSRNQAPVLVLPMPDGTNARFRVWESSIMEPALAAKFPELKTFAGQGIDDPYATIRFDFNPYFGFSGQILSVNGNYNIDPYARGDVNNYVSFYKNRQDRTSGFQCFFEREVEAETANRMNRVNAGVCRGTELSTYRLAVACTGEYAVAVCLPNAPTVPLTMAAITTAVNRVTGVYESELSVRLLLVANNDLIVYLNGATDPYTNNNGGTMLGQNQINLTNVIGSANYDIGHVFSTGGGGIAGLGVVCSNTNKARGVTGLPNPVGDDFYIDYVAHEMGHQFRADHTFNSNLGACNGNGSPVDAYEVGSGTTIMGYAGICDNDDIQFHSDPFFHVRSFDEIGNFVQTGGGNSCKGTIATGNTLPIITAMNNNGANIPLNTPFTLTGAATDANGDAISYDWEEWDLGPSTTWNGGNANTTSPLFKSRIPKTSGSRTFPDMAVILAGYPANPAPTMGGNRGETLPTQARALKFRLTVRDNRAGGGGVVTGGDGCQTGFTGTFQINTIAGTGPFVVTVPNGGESYASGSTQTITWNEAGTFAAPISATDVKISLSTDGGATYPTVLLASTPNDGSQAVTIPASITTTARIKIEAIGNIFFDISNANFAITVPPAGFSFNSPAPVVSSCPTPTSLSATLTATYFGGHTANINLTATVAPSGTVTLTPATLTTTTTSTTVTLNNTNTLPPATYTVTVTGTSTGVPTQIRDILFTITPSAPVITAQPTNQTVCAGNNATFTVTAPGTTTYQWQVSTDNGANWGNVGTNAASFTVVAPTTVMNGYQYRVIASTLCGSTTSSVATLTVNAPAVITTQPANLTICEGASTSFSVVATTTVGTLTYQWQFSTDNGNTWTNIPGATTATYGQTNVNTTQNGYRFRVVVTSGCGSLPSNGAILTVNAYPAISFSPTATICLSDPAFTLVALPAGGTFSGTGVTGNTFTPTVAGVGPEVVTYTAINAGCQTAAARTIEVEECANRHLTLEQYPAVFVYPIPNNGDFKIRMNTDLYTKLNIKIYNSMGQLVKTEIATGLGFGSIIPVHLFNMPTGTYHVFLSNDEKGSVSRRGFAMAVQKQ